MLLAPSPRNANFGNNGSSGSGKHFPFDKVKYDRPGECSPEKDCLR